MDGMTTGNSQGVPGASTGVAAPPGYTPFSLYGYTPQESYGIAFVTLFGLSALLHVGQALRSRRWILIPTMALGATGECIGWVGRLWSSQNVLLLKPYLVNVILLIFSPVFFSGYLYYALGGAIKAMGPQYSILRPTWYLAIFLTADILSLLIQAGGGGWASSLANTTKPISGASNMVLAGILFQLCTMAIFSVLAVDFFVRRHLNRPYRWHGESLVNTDAPKKRPTMTEGNHPRSSDSSSATTVVPTAPIDSEKGTGAIHPVNRNLARRWDLHLATISFASICIIARGIFRSIELHEGWFGRIQTTEKYTNWLDGFLMLLCTAAFNIIHPWFLFGRAPSWTGIH